MINLLPEKYKLELKKDNRLKFFISFFFALSVVLLVSLSGLVFMNFYVGVEKIYYQAELQGTNKDFERYKKLSDDILTINKKALEIDNFLSQKKFKSDVLNKIFATLPADVIIKSFSLSPGKDGYDITLSGYSPDDDQLYLFKESLEKSNGVSAVSFPLSAWTQEDAIDFSVNFKFKQN